MRLQRSRIKRVGTKLGKDFVVIPNALARDAKLTPRAKAVALYLWSLPDGWELNTESIAVAVGLNKRTVLAGIDDLIEARWLKRDELANDSGQIFGYVYVIQQSRRFGADFGTKSAPPKKTNKREGLSLPPHLSTCPSGKGDDFWVST